MSLSDLEKMKLLRPKDEWTGTSERSKVQPVYALVTSAVGIAGCVLMAVGNGHAMTWIGLLMFTVALVVFTWVNLRGVRKT